MKFFETSKSFNLNKPTYIKLRWIAIIGQLLTVNLVAFYFNFKFNYILSNTIIIFSAISNCYLIYFYKEQHLNNSMAFAFLNADIFQLSFLFYLTGGITNPFIIFLIIPCVFSSTNLDLRTNLLLCLITIISIVILTKFHVDLPSPLSDHFHVSNYYYYSLPIALIIALIFLNYFGIKFGAEDKIRKDALNKMEEVIAKERELLSLGGQAAAAAHSFGTPLSTIKIIAQDFLEQFKDDKILKKDIELLVSQVNRCDDILKKLTLNPNIDDEFIDKNITIKQYLTEIIKTFEEISEKTFILNFKQDSNNLNFNRSIEIVYGLRNFIGNANKFANQNIYITIKSNSDITNIIIEDDGYGFTKDILNKIGKPYMNTLKSKGDSKKGLGLGIFIGKTLLEKNKAKILFRNSETRGGAEINITWKNTDLMNI